MDRSFWNFVAPALAEKTAVLTYDCRGHGASDKPKGPYRVEQFAGDLADLLDHVGWRSAIVAGASMGGCITLAFAAAYPARATALGLFDTTAWYNAADKWEERAATAETKGLEAMIEFQTTRWFTDAFRAQRKDVLDASVKVLPRHAACSAPVISARRCLASRCRPASRSAPRITQRRSRCRRRSTAPSQARR
jgi:3-oxoadipate enol-lactonase